MTGFLLILLLGVLGIKTEIRVMILGDTGVGKSTWLHSLINYIQNIQFEENNRYYLFDEKNLKEKYHVGYGITKNPTIYDIKASNPLMQPLRIQ